MNRATKALIVLALAGVMLAMVPSVLRATSNVPEPGAFGIPINPNASGTKVSGPVSVAYDIHEDNIICRDFGGRRVDNMFVVLTLQQGNNIRPFNRALDPANPFCFPGNTVEQVNFFLAVITQEVIPHFFGCTAGVNCPTFEVKSITNFLSSANGAMSMNLTLAVH